MGEPGGKLGKRLALDEEIGRHYSLGLERERLRGGEGDVERLRTEDILYRHLPSPPAVICDVGGAAGIYAFPLAQKGYHVHLIDPVPLHIQQAQSHSTLSGIPLESIVQGDARALNIATAFADAVLLFGPLYHLVEKAGRMAALQEAQRILKPGGLLFAAAISRYASFMDGLSKGFFGDAQFRELIRIDLASGQHRNPGNSPQYFTTAYFHRPDELVSEVCEANFREVKILGIEGPAWGAAHFGAAAGDVVQRKVLFEMLTEIEAEPSIVGASAHFMAVARKAGVGVG